MSRGSTPRHSQTARDLSFAMQLNVETLWHFGSNSSKGNFIHSPYERPNVIKHAIAGYLRLPRPAPVPALMRVLHRLRR